MKKFGLLSSSAMGSAALFGLSLAFAAPAHAQDAPTPATTTADQDQDQADQGGQNVEVTGTRIRRPNIESNVPIVSVTADEIADGDPSVGDALNDLPSLRSTFSQANSVRFIGTTGLNILDLRGLGITRTLVLVNGRRHITALPGDYQVDINTIPSDLIERIDVITGGSSAVYGSDAIAGVVNFVLRRDYDGIRLRGQAGISQQGDRGIQFVSLTAGRNFADDRANIAVNLEYVNADALYFGDRPELTGAYDGRCQFNAR
jgi:outer membrane receptor protein involved in Fe transport